MLITRWAMPLITVAGLICFFSSGGAAAEETAVAEYKAVLETLDRSNLDSIEEATTAYHKLFADKSDFAAQQKAFRKWSEFADEVTDSELGRIIESGLINRVGAPYETLYVEPRQDMDPQAKRYLADLRKRGLAVQQAGEGETEIVFRFSYIKDNFFPYMGDSMKQIFTLRHEFQEEDFNRNIDASPERSRAWIIRFEKFVKQYPSSFEEKLQEMVQRYVLSGASESGFSSDQKISFQQFLKENKTSRYYPLIKQYYQYLEKHQFRPNVEVGRKLLDKYNQLINH